MTANANPKRFNIDDGLVVRNVERNVVGSRKQLSLQTVTLEGGRHDDASDHQRKTVPGIRPKPEKKFYVLLCSFPGISSILTERDKKNIKYRQSTFSLAKK